MLKSSDKKGNMMTRTMIKKEFFTNDSFKFKINNPNQQQDVLLEFCLPYAELKHIVEGLVQESSIL